MNKNVESISVKDAVSESLKVFWMWVKAGVMTAALCEYILLLWLTEGILILTTIFTITLALASGNDSVGLPWEHSVEKCRLFLTWNVWKHSGYFYDCASESLDEQLRKEDE